MKMVPLICQVIAIAAGILVAAFCVLLVSTQLQF